MMGRVSLNPAVHADVVGTIVFPLIALFTNVPLLGWAKPVPVNTLRLKHWRRDYMLIAAAGPVSNLLLAVLASLAWRAVQGYWRAVPDSSLAIIEPVAVFLNGAISINIMLALFNLIPIPPLDGGNVLGGLLPERAAASYDRILRPYGFIILYGLMFSGMLYAIIGPPRNVLMGWLA